MPLAFAVSNYGPVSSPPCDRDKAATKGQLKMSIAPDAGWSLGVRSHNQRFLYSLSDAHVLRLQRHASGQGIHAHVDKAPAPIYDSERLRLSFLDEDAICPLCGGTFDCFGDGPAVCTCAADRTLRPHAVAHVLYQAARAAGLAPRDEMSGPF